MKYLFEVADLAASYQSGDERLPVLRGLSFGVPRGGFSAIIGPSGCGKSTLFNILSGLEAPDGGSVRLEGRAVEHLRGHVAYMQQKDLLLPWRTVLDNALLGPEIQGGDLAAARNEARGMLPAFGLEGFGDSYPDELSGGMRQRVALLRTVLCRRDILLLDEPFGALDAITRREMQRWFLDVWKRLGTTVVLVTHDVEEALLLADTVHVLSGRPARVAETVQVETERPRRLDDPGLVALRSHILHLLEEGSRQKEGLE